MTMTTNETRPRAAAAPRKQSMTLAATEYRRFASMLSSLAPEDWSAPTVCAGWDVRAVAAHCLGMAEMAASIRENKRQNKLASARGGIFIDALTALQVDERAGMTADQIGAQFAKRGPAAARGRRMAPFFIRRRTLPVPQNVNGHREAWTIGFLVDTILTRDPWMHRIDIARATGADLVLTPDHDGAIVDGVVREWAERHGRPYTLTLTGPAGGTWSSGSNGEHLELDAIEFCWRLAGRGDAGVPFGTEVPF
jgi:uncharacterized protein (TIGR03083 family)